MKTIALIGNPNCGKTTLYNNLTGASSYVGNWPGVTVQKDVGMYKKLDDVVSIVDLPGIYSLSPYTSEEIVSRNFLIDENPDCVINVVDASNLERNLYLTSQILECDVPVVIALNMTDVLEQKGESIDTEILSNRLGVPCIEISALKELNIEELMILADKTSETKRIGSTILEGTKLSHLIKDVAIAFKAKEVAHPLFHAVKLVESDKLETKNHKDLLPIVSDFKKTFNDDTFGNDLEAIIANDRYYYIQKTFSPLVKKTKKIEEVVLVNKNRSIKIDKILTNKWASVPIFLFILFLIFHFTFSEDLFYLNKLGLFGSDGLTSFKGTRFEGLFANGGINSLGVFLTNLITICTDFISQSIDSAMGSFPIWVRGFISEGVVAGVFAVIGFLPQILTIFLFFSILEDSGYMSRIAFILDKIFRRFGLSGRAFMPMIMGFGCSVPAIINTKTLGSEAEKVATIRVIPFFSCGAKLPVLTAVSGAIVYSFGVGNADLITLGMYVLGISVAVITLLIMRHTSMRGKLPPFMLELPEYHVPQFKSLMIHVWDKAKHFIEKAFTIILASTIIIWFIEHFSFNYTFLDNSSVNNSILAGIGQLIQPIFTPMGLGIQTGEFGWIFIIAIIAGLIAKENVIGVFSTIAATIIAGAVGSSTQSIGSNPVSDMILVTGVSIPALIAFIAFNMTTVPCMAAVATAKAELPKNKFKSTILFWLLVSYTVGTVIYLIGTYLWTIPLFVMLVIIVIFTIRFYEKRNPIDPDKEVSSDLF